MNKIYFDESGNTGQDMLNKNQKVFVLASVNYDENAQNEIKSLFNIDGEIHFQQLKKSGAGRKKILSFLNSSWIKEDHIILYYVNKELNACGQIVNLLIETVFHHKGYDLYLQGRHIAYMNWIFYFGKFFWNKYLFNIFLNAFIEMVRKKDAASINNFYTITEELYSQIDEKTVLEPVRKSRCHIEEVLKSVDKFSMDVTFSTFLVLCDLWAKKLGNKIDVRFDQSKQIEHYNKYIEETLKLVSKTKEPIEIGYDNRTMSFPHQISSVELVKSTDEMGVQCADLIASSLAFAYNNEEGKMEKFSKQIKESKLFQLSNAQRIWPSDDVSSKALGLEKDEGINSLDFLVRNFSQAFK
jgi:hypothetical protein